MLRDKKPKHYIWLMQKNKVTAAKIYRATKQTVDHLPDLLATEEPLEIRLGYGNLENRKEIRVAVIMRTPGNDIELALGFLFTEGIITNQQQILSAKHCTTHIKPEELGNVVRVELNPETELNKNVLARNFYMNSSCGVCGKSSIESLQVCSVFSNSNPFNIQKEIIFSLPEKLKSQQEVFEHTGGLHAVGLFTNTGEFILLREDVGRHNAFDKLVGFALQNNLLPLQTHIVVLSGRASFELLQKAYMAGVKVVVAIGAPSSLAVETARNFNICLIGFCKNHQFNIYTLPNIVV